MATQPTYTIEVGFDHGVSTPLASVTWTAISSHVKTWRCSRGRANELTGVEPGQAELMLMNLTRLFDPMHAAGTYFGKVKARRRIRISVVWNAVTYRLFTGYIERWPQDWQLGNYSTVPITAIDGFSILRQAPVRLGGVLTCDTVNASVTITTTGDTAPIRVGQLVEGTGVPEGTTVATVGVGTIDLDTPVTADGTGVQISFEIPAELTGARIGRILDEAGWPAADRAIDAGQTVIAAMAIDGDALSAVNATADLERGVAFCNGAGSVVFHDRHRRMKPPYLTATQTLGDSGVELPYRAISGDWDDTEVRNVVRVSRAGSDQEYAVEDATSKADYGPISLELTELALTTDVEAKDLADWLLYQLKNQKLRFPAIALDPHSSPAALFPALFAMEISDRVTVKRRPQNVGSAISEDQHVESIAFGADAAAGKFGGCVVQLSPADPVDYWILGTSLLGVDTVLAY